MSYRCGVCTVIVPAGRPMIRHAILKPSGDIAREVPTCERCLAVIANGVPVQDLIEAHRPKQPLPAAIIAAIQPPPMPVGPPPVRRVTFGRN